jgi:tRNA(fMet)-specific endonuclease VapC
MPLRYLLDTNICIYIAKTRPEEVLARFRKLSPGEVAMSVITYGELSYGARKSRRRAEAQKMLRELAALIPVLGIGSEVADCYGEIRGELEARGRVIGNNDLWIASHAVALGVPLVTNNEREFNRIPRLSVQNWVRKGDRPQVQERADRYLLKPKPRKSMRQSKIR